MKKIAVLPRSKAALLALANEWAIQGTNVGQESLRIWADLGTGKLPQEDAIIYKAYEKCQESHTLLNCANELLKTIKEAKIK